jgi:hypothetical protein
MSNASKDALDLVLQERKREAYERIGKPATVYVCPYCGAECPSGEEWQQWSHCHEVGHAVQDAQHDQALQEADRANAKAA